MLKAEMDLDQRDSRATISPTQHDQEVAGSASAGYRALDEKETAPKIQVKKNGQYLGTLLG
jgi:hypothetical protein